MNIQLSMVNNMKKKSWKKKPVKLKKVNCGKKDMEAVIREFKAIIKSDKRNIIYNHGQNI